MSRAPFFSLESDTLGTLRLAGAITFANAGRALAHAPQAPREGSPLQIDLSALENADSATLAVLIAWAAAANQRGASLSYRRTPPALRNLAKLCDVDKLLAFN